MINAYHYSLHHLVFIQRIDSDHQVRQIVKCPVRVRAPVTEDPVQDALIIDQPRH